MPNLNKKTHSRPHSLYRIQNWATYDQKLVERGSLTFWLSDDLATLWNAPPKKQRGATLIYSDEAIRLLLTVKEVFHLTNRSVEGFMRSLFQLLHLALPVPDHSTLSKRGQRLPVPLPKKVRGPLTLVLDSTGLKLYGAGEWKVRQHGLSKRRTWRKVHLGIEPQSGEIQAVVLSENSCSDAAMVNPLLQQLPQPLTTLIADGGYDQRQVYIQLAAHSPQAQIHIPPRKNARIWQHGNTQAERLKRDENLRYIRRHGRRLWKTRTGYHIRLSVETTMFRLKSLFGDHLSARLLPTQTTQVLIRCAALNRITQLGMPQSYKVC